MNGLFLCRFTKINRGGLTLNSWPLVLAEAAHFAGWSPNAKDNQVKQLLETFTGRKASVITGIEDEDKRCEPSSEIHRVELDVECEQGKQ